MLPVLREESPNDLRVVANLFPLEPSSRLLALATVAAGEQREFWPMHDLFFAHQDRVDFDALELGPPLGANQLGH